MVRANFRNLPKYLAISWLLLIAINEFLIYVIYGIFWPRIPCKTSNCTRILLVSDPQLLGDTFDRRFFSGLATYDSDRYLKQTYREAYHHVKPNIVLFLGDLLDEGSVTTDLELYTKYCLRFVHIFNAKGMNEVPQLYLPGDNDIGGEHTDRITIDKRNRFRACFNSPDMYNLHSGKIQFFNTNALTHELPRDVELLNNYWRIALTHVSLLSYQGVFMSKVMEQLKPQVIFSGHLHVSRIITYPPTHIENLSHGKVVKYNMRNGLFLDRDTNADYTEIMVPTCSYRMGTTSMGYGMAVIDDGILYYAVISTPKRFIFLAIYGAWIITTTLLLLLHKRVYGRKKYPLSLPSRIKLKYNQLTSII